MNEVKQAFSISAQHKKRAHEIYKESVAEMVNKNYTPATDDAFIDLSALFGMRWLSGRAAMNNIWEHIALYAEANTAFNYANIHYREPEAFVTLAKQLVTVDQRVSGPQLRKIAAQMNHLLTATTPQAVRERISL